jgi:hypothetical protein
MLDENHEQVLYEWQHEGWMHDEYRQPAANEFTLNSLLYYRYISYVRHRVSIAAGITVPRADRF